MSKWGGSQRSGRVHALETTRKGVRGLLLTRQTVRYWGSPPYQVLDGWRLYYRTGGSEPAIIIWGLLDCSGGAGVPLVITKDAPLGGVPLGLRSCLAPVWVASRQGEVREGQGGEASAVGDHVERRRVERDDVRAGIGDPGYRGQDHGALEDVGTRYDVDGVGVPHKPVVVVESTGGDEVGEGDDRCILSHG